MLIDVPRLLSANTLSTWLKTEATKSRKQRRTLKQRHIDLCALRSDERIAAFARQRKVTQLERANSASKSTTTRQRGENYSINLNLTSNYINRVGQNSMQIRVKFRHNSIKVWSDFIVCPTSQLLSFGVYSIS